MNEAKGRTAELSMRHELLLSAIQRQGGEWGITDAHYLLRQCGLAPRRRTAAADLRHLARLDRLVKHDEPGRLYYTPKGGA